MNPIPGYHDATLTAIEWGEREVVCRFSAADQTDLCLRVRGEGLIVWSGGECLPVIVSTIALVSPESAQIESEKRLRLRKLMDEMGREWCLLISTSVGDELAILGSGEMEYGA